MSREEQLSFEMNSIVIKIVLQDDLQKRFDLQDEYKNLDAELSWIRIKRK